MQNENVEVLRNAQDTLEQRFGVIEYRSPAALQAYANNPREHPEKQIIQLMASVSAFGFTIPVLVDTDGVIIAGEARVAAAVRLDIKQVPVLVAEHWNKEQIRAYRLADNRLAEASSWSTELLQVEIAGIIEVGDMNIEVLGWNTAEIDVLLDGSSSVSESDPADEQPPVPDVPVTRVGDLWQLGEHRLLCGSSLDGQSWERLLAGKTAAMAITDPPYNVPVQGHVSGLGKVRHAEFAMASGEMSSAEFVAFNVNYLTHLSAACGDGSVLMTFIDWRHLQELLSAAEKSALRLINLCVWKKLAGGMGSLYRSQHELCLILKKGTAAHVNNIQLGRYGRCRTNVWEYAGANSFGSSRDADLADHPTVKPTALVADAIRDVSKHGDIVLDAFMGSGTTILAAERTRRIAYGIEIEPGYVDVALKRWSKMTGNEPVLEQTGEILGEVGARRRTEAAIAPLAV